MNETENVLIDEVTMPANSETDTKEADFSENAEELDEISLLRAEIQNLRDELNSKNELEKANSRILSEISEFKDYFPEVDIHEIPDEVWQKVKNGASLSASFALNLRKIEIERKKASDFNEKNRRMSTGSLSGGENERYYSPSEVKKMTPAQVKAHYDDIIDSMRHWN